MTALSQLMNGYDWIANKTFLYNRDTGMMTPTDQEQGQQPRLIDQIIQEIMDRTDEALALWGQNGVAECCSSMHQVVDVLAQTAPEKMRGCVGRWCAILPQLPQSDTEGTDITRPPLTRETNEYPA